MKEVQLVGLERVNDQVVRSKLEVQPGQPFNSRMVSRDIRRLYELGYFSNIVADASLSGDDVVVTYTVEEKRSIDEVKITGNRKVKERAIRGVLTWREGDSFASEAYDDERDAILKLYQSKGFPSASVDIIVEEIGASRVRITYVINEGKKARVKQITFVGNETLSEHKLRKAMKTKHAWWFLGGKYDPDVFEEDLGRITDEYGNYGHLEADVENTDLAFSEDGKRVNVTIYVKEGPQYHVDTLDVAGNVVYDTDEIIDKMKVIPGEVHNKSQVEKDAETINSGYEDSGYVYAGVTPQVTLDRENKTTHIVHRVREGDLKYIREIKITGNSITRDDVIRREVLSFPGERFDGGLLRASQSRLEDTEWFETVRFTLENLDDTEDGRFSNLLVDVEEGKTGYFNFGGGYSSDEGLGGFTELTFNNFDISNWPKFSGGGEQLRLKLNISGKRNQYNISYTNPEFMGYPLIFGVDLFDERYEYDDVGRYTEDTSGAQIRFAKLLSPFVTARTMLRYSDTSISDLPWYAGITYPREYWDGREGSTTISSIWGITRNTVDTQKDTTSGSRHDLQFEFAGIGGDNNFYKLEHDSTWYWPLDDNRKWILSFRTREGWVDEYGSSDYVPLQDRFFAGGTNTIRGYDSRDVGPKKTGLWGLGETVAIGGELRLLESLEVKYRLNKLLRLYGFVDSGGVWETASDLDFGDMRYSAGIGLGFDIPRMGPIRVDYGFPLNADEDQGNGKLHLQSGFRF